MATAFEDYYALLGVRADTDRVELRRAWRRLALKWHPDRAGSAATATFQKISAAYTVLSDPVARAAYDRKWRAVSSGAAIRPPSGAAPSPKEPARSPRAAAPPQGVPATPPIEPPRRAPAVMLRRLSGPLTYLLARGVARRAEANVIEIFLNREEVLEGGMVMISMYVPVRCPNCATADAAELCARCEGARTIEELFSAWLAVRPGVADGIVLEPSALLPGMVHPVSFRVRHEDAA